MPRVKIDYVVSFSSEDPDNQANNLLEWEVSKKKWLCAKGESSCSVVLQLTKAVKIESINIGAYHAASVEVLVGLSEKPNEQFEVLVPTCMLLSPSESRREASLERVRSFSGAQLAGARDRRWDRVRVVCAQPYNKHCKYGLSFIHIQEPQSPTLSAFSRSLPLDSASDDEDFRPGELFAQHARAQRGRDAPADAQIRQASMNAIKNMSDKSSKLLKTPITRTSNRDQNHSNTEQCSNRKKESLMYTDDDDQPHAKIDQVIQKHKEQKDKDTSKKVSKENEKDKTNLNSSKTKEVKEKPELDVRKQPEKNITTQKNVRKDTSSGDDTTSHKKRKRTEQKSHTDLGPICTSLDGVLAGVQFTLSGYENPSRAQLRAAGLALGAAYAPDWSRSTTHIVCAFPNTPKLRAARAAGARACAVRGDWLRACADARRRLPWRWFAVQPSEREAPPAHWGQHAGESHTEMDTDDEIEKVLQQKKKRLTSPSNVVKEATGTKNVPRDKNASRDAPEASTPRDVTDGTSANSSRDSDVTFVRDERVRGNVTIEDSDSDVTDEEDRPCVNEEIDKKKELPNFFEGLTFSVAADLDAQYDRALLARYIKAYGGLVVEPSEVVEESEIQYAVSSAGAGPTPEWVWRCHGRRALASPDDGR